jgi:hypothetical protein
VRVWGFLDLIFDAFLELLDLFDMMYSSSYPKFTALCLIREVAADPLFSLILM